MEACGKQRLEARARLEKTKRMLALMDKYQQKEAAIKDDKMQVEHV